MNDLIAERIAQKLTELVEIEKLKTAAIVRLAEARDWDGVEHVEVYQAGDHTEVRTGADALTIPVPREDWGKL